MTAPLRRSGITPRVRTTSAASRAILIKASIARIYACSRSLSSPLAARPPQQKSPGQRPGLLCFASLARSVLRDDRAAEAVVHPGGDEVSVLLDVVVAGVDAREHADASEVVVVGAHEQVIILDAERPVRSEGVFHAGANRAAPAGLLGTIDHRAEEHTFVAVVGHRSTALDVEQDVVGGIADLAGEQAERVDLAAVNRESKEADVRTAEIGPVALRFETEHPVAGLPAIADLTTDGAAASVVATFRAAANRNVGPAVVARAPAAVGADVESAPVIHCSDHRRRLGVRTRSEIRSECRR